MKKRRTATLIAVIAAVIFMSSILLLNVSADGAAANITVKIAGHAMTAEAPYYYNNTVSEDKPDGGGYAYYDTESQTLTLCGVDIQTDERYGIYIASDDECGFEIVLADASVNTVLSANNTGLYVSSDVELTVSGRGQLNISAFGDYDAEGNTDIYVSSLYIDESASDIKLRGTVRVIDHFSVTGGNIEFTDTVSVIGEAEFSGGSAVFRDMLAVFEKITVSEDAELNAYSESMSACIYIGENAEFIVDGGKIRAAGGDICHGIYIYKGGSFILNGGDIYALGGSGAVTVDGVEIINGGDGVNINNDAYFEINGGKLNAVGGSGQNGEGGGCGLYIAAGAEFKMSKGEINASGADGGSGFLISQNALFEMSDGIFNAMGGSKGCGVYIAENASVMIASGSFFANGAGDHGIYVGKNALLSISGGALESIGSGSRINGINVDGSMQLYGGVLGVYGDINAGGGAEALLINGGASVTVSGGTLYAGDSSNTCGIRVNPKASLIINDGEVKAKGGDNSYGIIIGKSASLEIYGGKLDTVGSGGTSSALAVTSGGSVFMSGGELIATSDGQCAISIHKNSKFIMNDGSLEAIADGDADGYHYGMYIDSLGEFVMLNGSADIKGGGLADAVILAGDHERGEGASFTIYGGELNAVGTGTKSYGLYIIYYSTLEMCGGSFNAEGSSDGRGICVRESSSLKIYDGALTAVGGVNDYALYIDESSSLILDGRYADPESRTVYTGVYKETAEIWNGIDIGELKMLLGYASITGAEAAAEYNISFITNGGIEIKAISMGQNSFINAEDFTSKQSGLRLEGWYTDEALTQRAGVISVSKDLTLYAKWLPMSSILWFEQTGVYSGYIDVDESRWYGSDSEGVIRDITLYGIMTGDSTAADGSGKFRPDDEITLAEIIKMAATAHSIYYGMENEFTATSPWYDTYIKYAIEHGIITEGDFDDYSRAAVRGEVAYIMANTLPGDELDKISEILPPDIGADDLYGEEIHALYEAGILRGNDASGSFDASRRLTRAEAAAIMVRLICPDRRISG